MYTDCYYDDIQESYDCLEDFFDVLMTEELDKIQHEKQEERYNAPISMDSLGLSWNDFI